MKLKEVDIQKFTETKMDRQFFTNTATEKWQTKFLLQQNRHINNKKQGKKPKIQEVPFSIFYLAQFPP